MEFDPIPIGSCSKEHQNIYQQWFNCADSDGDGRITGNDATKFFAMSNLSCQDLKQVPLSSVTSIIDGLKRLYIQKLKPLEVTYHFNDFVSPLLSGTDERSIPGNTGAVQADMPFNGLKTFGTAFLSKFECSQMPHPLLEHITFVESPGVLSGEKQRTKRAYDFTGVTILVLNTPEVTREYIGYVAVYAYVFCVTCGPIGKELFEKEQEVLLSDQRVKTFDRYASASGKVINPSKSTIFSVSMNSTRLQNIANRIVKIKLSAWKASLLSLAGRVQLIKSVIHDNWCGSPLVHMLNLLHNSKLQLISKVESFIHEESSQHVFFHCSFAHSLWDWFLNMLNINLQVINSETMWNICESGWGPQCKLVISAASINIINSIWYNRNQASFNNVKPCLRSAKAFIMSNTVISGNATKATSTNSMSDFLVIKAFNVKINSPKAPSIKEIFWMPPKSLDKMQHGRGSNRNQNHANIGIDTAFHADLLGVMFAIEIAHNRGWRLLWLETDSLLVTLACKTPSMVPWKLRNRWNNCMVL
ncbi:eh domain-containing protein 1-like [Trifolium pratense]|uniref:Eh domain-containing protein 1-like n=1 Tax=Trifolium pratense TaxID=57577 RepID=A0A2K3NUF3_TRIPR|nr:eh domain-containing protein 1-like [Trifolium pratense]